jgi:hypothetical protein
MKIEDAEIKEKIVSLPTVNYRFDRHNDHQWLCLLKPKKMNKI